MYQTDSCNKNANSRYKKIDHIAIAVNNLDSAIDFFSNILGFDLVQRRDINGKSTGMISAEMEHNGLKFVLCQGKESASQVSCLINNFGAGVAHIALSVDDVKKTYHELKNQGLDFDTDLIEGPGLSQVFSTRDANTGLSFEFIQRTTEEGFLEANVEKLFKQLEEADAY